MTIKPVFTFSIIYFHYEFFGPPKHQSKHPPAPVPVPPSHFRTQFVHLCAKVFFFPCFETLSSRISNNNMHENVSIHDFPRKLRHNTNLWCDFFFFTLSQEQHDETDLVPERGQTDATDRNSSFPRWAAKRQSTDNLSKPEGPPRQRVWKEPKPRFELHSEAPVATRLSREVASPRVTSGPSSAIWSLWNQLPLSTTSTQSRRHRLSQACSPCGPRTHGRVSRTTTQRLNKSGAPVTSLQFTLRGLQMKTQSRHFIRKTAVVPVSLAWTYLEILSMLAICFWLRMTSMAAHTYWTTLGSACLFFTTRDMISLFISVVGAAGRREISRFSLALPPTKVG